MTEQQKDLLVKDLCARLPYGVKVHIEHDTFYDEIDPYDCTLSTRTIDDFTRSAKLEVKPYLRPMSSMTEEEDKEFALWQVEAANSGFLFPTNAANLVNWLNQHHFDYNLLIEKGLALVAPKDMYKC